MINIYIESGVNQAKHKGKEVTNEQEFVIRFIEHHFPDKKSGRDFEVIGFGGKDLLINNAPVLEDSVAQGNTNIVIFDADTTDNKGGFTMRKQEIMKIKSQACMEFELFLWPNNHDDGDFESLLLQSIRDSHRGIIDCFDNFTMCVGGRDPEHRFYDIPGRKSEIYTYIELMRKTPAEERLFKKGYWLFDKSDLWNLDTEASKPFFLFLKPYFE